ncbi:hypothetical protein MPTK1_5g14580 [Marchantia polymorpha subsp. ruderalis]|uniref:Uncharacterized protein n=2 Tax=Marchantia polymorpha TaxID=3197 RepID=A0AAF6BID6_MARPO|nr:hypothetical protein MARPO_0032s0150 [Marchantia polymorpha]BBN11770.1 hypothetical protein Mp_5g14580 [Marchantia polymorpha subsp. ruderalis]|eukprot:PTQ41988.1 hypothetical protein MARPO_0032s0150 [Marchantia polymorpha]
MSSPPALQAHLLPFSPCGPRMGDLVTRWKSLTLAARPLAALPTVWLFPPSPRLGGYIPSQSSGGALCPAVDPIRRWRGPEATRFSFLAVARARPLYLAKKRTLAFSASSKKRRPCEICASRDGRPPCSEVPYYCCHVVRITGRWIAMRSNPFRPFMSSQGMYTIVYSCVSLR